jgi:hypothetical protein
VSFIINMRRAKKTAFPFIICTAAKFESGIPGWPFDYSAVFRKRVSSTSVFRRAWKKIRMPGEKGLAWEISFLHQSLDSEWQDGGSSLRVSTST